MGLAFCAPELYLFELYAVSSYAMLLCHIKMQKTVLLAMTIACLLVVGWLPLQLLRALGMLGMEQECSFVLREMFLFPYERRSPHGKSP